MTLNELKRSVGESCPEEELSEALRALWYDRRGDWKKAHEIVQDLADAEGAWVHAYLHRKEGDLGNARYWYQRARQPESKQSLEQEWDEIAGCLLART